LEGCSIVLYASRVNFFSVGVTDAHFKEFGNFVSESDTLKQFASKELLIPEDNFNNLEFMLPCFLNLKGHNQFIYNFGINCGKVKR